MTYEIIQPPVTLQFQEMTKKELKNYFQWYMYILPERIEELTSAVNQTAGFEGWQPDLTPSSLDLLGEWFASNVERRFRTEKEKQEMKEKLISPIEISDYELTEQTISISMDIGMYVSQVFLKNNPSLKWEQPFGSKNNIDYGQPAIAKFIYGFFNPTHIMITLAYGISKKNKTGSRLREIYNHWSKSLGKNEC